MDQSFEKNLENDLQRLAAEIKMQQERPGMEKVAGQEIVKEALRAFPEVKGGASAAAPGVPQPQSKSPLPEYAQNAPAEVKLEIEYLLDVALKKGIGPALVESEKSPAFVQDAFHDALAGRLYPELQKRGMVK